MAVTIDATAGGTNSNAYCTLAQAETYHEEHLHVTTWSDATEADKNAAIVWATRILDEQIDWYGSKMTTTQALRWPRSGIVTPDGESVDEETIPQFLANATAELARLLIASDRTTDPATLGFKELKAGSLQMKIDKRDRKWVVPQSVWAMVRPYGERMSRPLRTLVRC